jgi:hypothetical protein
MVPAPRVSGIGARGDHRPEGSPSLLADGRRDGRRARLARAAASRSKLHNLVPKTLKSLAGLSTLHVWLNEIETRRGHVCRGGKRRGQKGAQPGAGAMPRLLGLSSPRSSAPAHAGRPPSCP